MTSVSAIIVTRGDVDLLPVLESLPEEWEVLVWNNKGWGPQRWRRNRRSDLSWMINMLDPTPLNEPHPDLAVYGRYAAIEHAKNDLIYVQDDDCVVSNPRALVDRLRISGHPDGFKGYFEGGWFSDTVVCNMPERFRHDFYREHALVGFGAVFHRDLPAKAFARYWNYDFPEMHGEDGFFNRRCDLVFTALTPRVLMDVPHEDLPWASDANRMWKRPEHQGEGQRMLDLVLKMRDA